MDVKMELLFWILVVAAQWRSVPGQDFGVDPARTLYPVLGQSQTLDCDCGGLPCEQVTWFRVLTPEGVAQVLGRSNQADRVSYEPGMEPKVRISKKAGSGYTLRVLNTSTSDRGVYFCVLKIRKEEEQYRSGVLLLPGETPVTEVTQKMILAPPTPSHCPCSAHGRTTGCGALVLWSLVGLISALSLTLLCTVYYYYRLPKKCRHRFVKKK